MPERPRRPLDPVDPPRRRPEDPLRQRERERDRREVGDQQVLDHVERRELLAEPVDRADQRDEQQRDPGPPERRPAPPGRPRPTLPPRRPPPEPVGQRVREQRSDHHRREGPRRVDGHDRRF
jgi:hypothetical protein